jgi:hypothetical protein
MEMELESRVTVESGFMEFGFEEIRRKMETRNCEWRAE